MFKTLRSRLAAALIGKSWKTAWAAGGDPLARGAELAQPFKQSPWVFRAVSLISAPISAQPLKFMAGDDEALSDAERDSFWSRPALSPRGRMSLCDFLEASVIWLNLKGECFWILDDTWISRTAAKSPVILAAPDKMRHIVRANQLIGWEYQDGTGSKHVFLPQDVVQIAFFNPYDPFRGLAPLESAMIAADADYAAGVFSKHLAQSNGDRGVYVIAKDGQIQEDQQKQIEARIREKRELNQKGIYKSLFLSGNVSIEDPKIQAADAAFIAGRIENRKEVFIAFGVPPSMADKAESYSVGAASDRFRLREDTCMPTSAKLMEGIEQIEARRSGKVFKVRQDWSLDPVMQQARNERSTAAVAMHQRGVPWEELNEFFSLGLGSFAGSDKAWLPLNLVAVEAKVDSASAETEDAAEAAATLDEPAAKIGRSASVIESLLSGSVRHPLPAIRSDKREQLWKHNMAARSKSEKLYLTQIRKALAEARKETLANLDNAEALKSLRNRGILDIIFDLAKFTGRMTTLLAAAARDAIAAADEQFNEDQEFTDDPWATPDPLVLEHIAKREPFLKDASQDIRDAVKEEIEAGITAGESAGEIAGRIKKAFNDIADERAATIARTETAIAYGRAHLEGMKAKGFEFKEWLTARDENVRLSHQHADGAIVPIDEPFTIGEAKLQHPGDPSAPAGEIINCRCVLMAARNPEN